MKILFVSYADKNFAQSKKRIMHEAKSSRWFDNIKIFSENSLGRDFCRKFSSILSEPRGGGYWIWKLDVLEQAFQSCSLGDIIVYCDAGCHINHLGSQRFQEYIEMLYASDYGFLSFQLTHPEKNYTTKECFEHFQVPVESEIRTSSQILSGVIIARKCDHSLSLIEGFRTALLKNPLIITDHYNHSQDIGFLDHRHDQSMLSILRKQYGSILIPDETWFPEFAIHKATDNPPMQARILVKSLVKLSFLPCLYDNSYFAKIASEKSTVAPFWALRLS